MKKYKTTYQLVTTHTHIDNSYEIAIQNFKNNFKYGLDSFNTYFPIYEWDRLLDQAFLTLNILRAATSNPKLSAHSFINANFYFNATPLDPPVTKVTINYKPANSASWDLNGKGGWYISPPLNHYRCVKCYFSTTGSEVSYYTVVFYLNKSIFLQ